jgi:hypothetical protein
LKKKKQKKMVCYYGRKSRNQACNKQIGKKKLVISISPKSTFLVTKSLAQFSLFCLLRKYVLGTGKC